MQSTTKQDESVFTWLHGTVFWWQVIAACCAVVATFTIVAFLIYISSRLTLHEQQLTFRDENLEALKKLEQIQAETLKQLEGENDRIIKAIEEMRTDQVELLQYGYFHKRNKKQ